MGREVRRVPKDWEHPRYPGVIHKPLRGNSFSDAFREYEENKKMWDDGFVSSYKTGEKTYVPMLERMVPIPKSKKESEIAFERYYGKKPKKEDYMPEWPEEEKTHYQMYETTSEGTPISPVMESPEALAKWLFEHKASAFGSSTASYEGWLRVCKGGYACSGVIVPGVGVFSGVEALKDEEM